MKKFLIVIINIIIILSLLIVLDFAVAKYSYENLMNSIAGEISQHKDTHEFVNPRNFHKFKYSLKMIHFNQIFKEKQN